MKKGKITVALDYVFGSKRTSQSVEERKLHLLYLAVTDYSGNYATAKLKCSDSSL